jgi:hypothetical protein
VLMSGTLAGYVVYVVVETVPMQFKAACH